MNPIPLRIKYTITIEITTVITFKPPNVKRLTKNVTLLIIGNTPEKTSANNKLATPSSNIVPSYLKYSGKKVNKPKNTAIFTTVALIILDTISKHSLQNCRCLLINKHPPYVIYYFTALVLGKRLLPALAPNLPLTPVCVVAAPALGVALLGVFVSVFLPGVGAGSLPSSTGLSALAFT